VSRCSWTRRAHKRESGARAFSSDAFRGILARFLPGAARVPEPEIVATKPSAGSPGRARLDLIVAALLFSTGGVCIKLLEGLTALQRAGLRSLIAAAFLVLAWPQARRGYTRKSLLFSLFYAGTLACFVAANTWTTAANAIFLQSTAPLYVLLLSPLVLKEKVRAADLLYMAALAVGLLLCFGEELFERGGEHAAVATAPRPFLGNVCGAASGILWACTIVGLRWFGKRSGEGEAGAGASVVTGNLTCFLLCLLLATVGKSLGGGAGAGFFEGLDALDLKKIGVLLFLGVFQVGLAYVCITRGMARVPALQASLLLLVEPTFNPLWSFLVLRERPAAWSLGGGAVILSATVLHGWLAPRMESDVERPA
jgi:drug/metabolite transporter (DMT)-like permease